MYKQSKFLYLPLEIFSRELGGMLVLSILSARNGWNVLIGGKQEIFRLIDKLPEGVFLLKSIVPGEIDIQKKIKVFGHKVTSIDAEGLLPSNGKSGVDLRFSEETINYSDLVFFWGSVQFEQVKKIIPSIKNKAKITGSPVIDYWNILKNRKMKHSNDKNILISTSFAIANYALGKDVAVKAIKNASGKNFSKDFYDEIILDANLQDYMLNRYYEFVNEIIKSNPNKKIILRPHTSENPDIWRKLSIEYKNVEMDKNIEISDSILQSTIFIQFNSTTAIEASLYGKPIITFIPKSLPKKLFKRMNKFSNLVSNIFNDKDSANKFIEKIFEGKKITYTKHNLEKIITVSSCEEKASDNILRHIEEIKPEKITRKFYNNLNNNFNSKIFQARRRIIWLLAWLDYYSNIFKGKYKDARNYYKQGKIKNSNSRIENIEEYIEELKADLNIDDGKLIIKKMEKNLFYINS